jgi:hypothetical protein
LSGDSTQTRSESRKDPEQRDASEGYRAAEEPMSWVQSIDDPLKARRSRRFKTDELDARLAFRCEHRENGKPVFLLSVLPNWRADTLGLSGRVLLRGRDLICV